MLLTDLIACFCSVVVLILVMTDGLEIWYIYVINTITGFMFAFQSPASTVSVGILVPKEEYSRVSGLNSFSNLVQYFTISVGILLGGALADFVFEPFMRCSSRLSTILQGIVGNGTGSGMAVMFLCTGILGFVSSILWYRNRQIRLLQYKGAQLR